MEFKTPVPIFVALSLLVTSVICQLPDRTPNFRYPYYTDMNTEGTYVLR